ncbi:lipoprotein signal peptidase [uncultured Alistipes sp.]|uniref:lipoprotein signal peptidase n=1 Tax=uncultured Alistipes sp. TaxID=538949 RepID=UPI0026348700|nr:lipoprotein signal peptidase [uncultured Alistipes sp.]
MNAKKLTILLVLLVLVDQALKIWVKTHMTLDEAIMVIPTWFQLRFVENNGAAFGMQLSAGTAFDWGKLILSCFRLAMIGLLGYYLRYLLRRKTPAGVLVGLTLILAGAVGNMIDSAFYGVVFSASTPTQVAHFGDGYAPLMMGRVVDMFYFPLFQWNGVPRWLSFLVDSRNYFFGAIFNLADAYISVAVVYLLIFQYKFFK